MKERQYKRIRKAPYSPKQEKVTGLGEIREDVAKVSPRDIANCTFESEISNTEDVEWTNTSRAKKTIAERKGSFNEGKERKEFSLSNVVMSVKQHMEVGEKCNEGMHDSFMIKNNDGGCKQKVKTTKAQQCDGPSTKARHKDRVAEKEKFCTQIRNGTATSRKKTVQVEQQTEETATSSSSSISKRVSRPRRTSIAYLQQTRAHRRAVAKERTERLKREREEEYEREQMRKLDGMAQEEREKAIQSLASERREREAARRREVKRVKNRESVEKSRVRELVFEAQVGSEWDALRKENDCMIQVVEWFKRENAIRDARKEVNGVVRKRKRRKLM